MPNLKSDEHVRYVITLRLSKTEHQQIKDLAKELNVSVSECIRMFLFSINDNNITITEDAKLRASRYFGSSNRTNI